MFDGVIMAGIGVFITLLGYRKIDIVRGVGPFVVVVGIGLAAWGATTKQSASSQVDVQRARGHVP
jgi:hypothetical protein